MAADAKKQRGGRPFVFTNLRNAEGVDKVVSLICKQGLLDDGICYISTADWRYQEHRFKFFSSF